MAQIGAFPTRTAAVTSQIREDIVSMRLQPGTVIRDNEMAERYGVSSSPIREALAQMHAERLVEIMPNKTKFVSRIDRKTVEDFLELHSLLVVHGFSRGAPRLTAKDMEQMHATIARMKEAGNQQDSALYIRNAREFLDPIYKAADNAELRRQVGLQATWLRRMITMLEPDYFDHVTRNYGQILSHLERGDLESASLCHHLALKRTENAILSLDLPDAPERPSGR